MENTFTLKDMPFPLLIKDVIDTSFTGIIFVDSNQWKKGLIFKKGILTAIQSNKPEELLGNLLKDMGLITEEENTVSLSKARITRRKQGEILLEMGVLRPDEIFHAIRQQMEIRFFDIFPWETGNVNKVAKSSIDKDSELTKPEFATLVRKGIMEYTPFSSVLDMLSPFADAIPKRSVPVIPGDTGVDTQKIEEYKVSEILLLGQDLPKALLAFYCTGIISFEESKYASLINKLRIKLKDIRDKDPYQRLEVDKTISDGGLKKAYIKLVKFNHPDVYSYADDPEVKRLANEIFTEIQKAYNTILKIKQLAPPEEKEMDKGIQAELIFSQASDALRAKDYQKALDLYKLCVKLNPDESVFMESLIKTMFLRWQNAGLGNSMEIKRIIREANKRFPRSDNIYIFLGWVLKKEGSLKAIEAFQRALKINPNNIDAQREIRLYHMRSKK
ncbi:MAG: DnaJ domain-containing protein [Thermodesulfobacteriota bacterium]|nr:DnaJ domain-containing protein [Thermodesulfobacteriota bacterium]